MLMEPHTSVAITAGCLLDIRNLKRYDIISGGRVSNKIVASNGQVVRLLRLARMFTWLYFDYKYKQLRIVELWKLTRCKDIYSLGNIVGMVGYRLKNKI